MRVTEDEARARGWIRQPAKRQKFGNRKAVTVDGEAADSQKEARVLEGLRRRERNREISDVKPQFTFPIHVNGHHICDYRADAVFVEDGRQVVVDCKSKPTRTLPAYRLKVKLMKAVHNIDVVEV